MSFLTREESGSKTQRVVVRPSQSEVRLEGPTIRAFDVLAGLLVVLVCIARNILLQSLEFTGEYLYLSVAVTRSTTTHQVLTPDPILYMAGVDYHPGYDMWLLLASRISGLPPADLQFLPVGTMLMGLTYFVLARKVFRSTALGALFAIYATNDHSLGTVYNTTVYSLSYPLFLLFVLLSLKILERKRIEYLLILLLLFVTSHLTHIESPTWMLALAIAVNVFLAIRVLAGSGALRKRSTWYFTLALFVIFLYFNKMIYNIWIPRLGRFSGEGPLSLFLSTKLLNPPTTGELYLAPPAHQGLTVLRIIQYVMIVAPVAVYLFIAMVNAFRQRSVKLDDNVQHLALWSAFVVTALLDLIAYWVVGWISFKFITLAFPILTVIALQKLKVARPVKYLASIVLVLVIVAGSILGMVDYIQHPPSRYEDAEASAEWFFSHYDPTYSVLTDLSTLGKYLVLKDPALPQFVWHWYDSMRYGYLVGATQAQEQGYELDDIQSDYIIADHQTWDLRMRSLYNTYYEPLSKYADAIENNTNIQKIYDDGRIWIYGARPARQADLSSEETN